jgi:hypothetical protein
MPAVDHTAFPGEGNRHVPPPFQTAPTGRDILGVFAARLVRILNDDRVLIPAELHKDIIAELSEKKKYRDKLVAAHLLKGMHHDDAARYYFEMVFERRLRLARSEHRHKGHELFIALCRRGIDARWQAAELVRSTDPLAGVDADNPPRDFKEVLERMRIVCRTHGDISKGNPAFSTRDRHGPLFLKLAGAAMELPEELSIWQAISCGPRKLRVLPERGKEYDEFCSLMIRALETANRPYGSLVGLWLSPKEWPEINVNTAKEISRFLSTVRDLAHSTRSDPTGIEVWDMAWGGTVPGYLTARDFHYSEIGRELCRSGVLRQPIPPQLPDDQQEGNVNIALLPKKFNECLEVGVINKRQAWLLEEIVIKGKTPRQVARSLKTSIKLGTLVPRETDIQNYIDELLQRIADYDPDPHGDIQR